MVRKCYKIECCAFAFAFAFDPLLMNESSFIHHLRTPIFHIRSSLDQ